MYKKLIVGLLDGETTQTKEIVNMFSEDDLPNLIYTRLSGFISLLFKDDELKSNDLVKQLVELHRLNYIRNIHILTNILKLNDLIKVKKFNYCWIKGVKDLYNNPDMLFYRKSADADIVVENYEQFRVFCLENGFFHGGYTYDGELVTASTHEIEVLEENHYELYPLSKIIPLEMNEFISDVNSTWLNKFRIFKDSTGGFFTDLTLDVHKELTFGLLPNWILSSNSRFPVMSNVDELWYLIHKCYYEVIKGDSRDLQLLITTVQKIKRYGIEQKDIENQMLNLDGFLNVEATDLLYKIAYEGLDENLLETFEEKVINYKNE